MLKKYSWEELGDSTVKKTADKTTFRRNNSGIPKEFRDFWDINQSNSPRRIKLVLDDEHFDAVLKLTRPQNPLTNIRWYKELRIKLKNFFEKNAGNNLENYFDGNRKDVFNRFSLVFRKIDSDTYEVQFLYK